MVVDDLQHICLFYAVHRLILLIMVYQDYLFLLYIEKTSPGNESQEPSLAIYDREITETLSRHNLFHIIYIVPHLKGNQIVPGHEVFYRNTLIDMLCRRKRIVRCADDNDLFLLRLPDNGIRYGRVLADYHTTGIHINSALLSVLPVAHDDQIIFCNKIRHEDPAGCCYHNLSLLEIAMLISRYDLTIDCSGYIPVLSPCLCQNGAVIYIHICLGNISDGDQALQLSVPGHRQRMYVGLTHLFPCRPDRNTAFQSLYFFQFHILDLLPQIRQKAGNLYFKMIQHILSLLIQLSCPPRFMRPASDLCLQRRIGDRRTDGICIRILMAYHIHFSFLFSAHKFHSILFCFLLFLIYLYLSYIHISESFSTYDFTLHLVDCHLFSDSSIKTVYFSQLYRKDLLFFLRQI